MPARWSLVAVLVILVGVTLALWHPWRSPGSSAVTSVSRVEVAGTKWATVESRYGHVFRAPRWMPRDYTWRSLEIVRHPWLHVVATNAVKSYTPSEGLRGLIVVTEARTLVTNSAPGLHSIRNRGVTLQVAKWAAGGPPNPIHDVLAVLIQAGHTYQINSDSVPLSTAVRVVRSLWRAPS